MSENSYKRMKISPSILSADFANLQKEAESVQSADYLHIDVMDGIFVPNITIGIPVVASLNKAIDMPLDVHLMIDRPERYIEQFVKAGADILTIHVESTKNPETCIKMIKELGAVPSVSIKPETPAEYIFPFLDDVGMVLVMTVEPGFGGQKMILNCLEKCIELKKEIMRRNLNVMIEADGGITRENLVLVKNSGVDISVVGSALFCNENREAIIQKMKI